MKIFGIILGGVGTIFIFFVHWIIGLLLIITAVILLLIAKPRESLKICPKCAEKIQEAAKTCRFCGADVSEISGILKRNEEEAMADYYKYNPKWSSKMKNPLDRV